MVKKNLGQEFRLKNIDKTRNEFTEEIKQNVLLSKKHKKVSTAFEYIKLVSAVTGCVSTSAFASLVDIPIGITCSALGLEHCVISAGIKKYESIIRKKY